MSRWPRITLLALFVGLLALQLYQGVQRLGAIGDERRREVVEDVRRGQLALARDLGALLEAQLERARLLARLPAAREAAESGADQDDAFRSLEALLAAWGNGESLALEPMEPPSKAPGTSWRGARVECAVEVPGTGVLLVSSAPSEPLLQAVRGFRPVPGAAAFLLDGHGDYLAHEVRAKEQGASRSGGLALDDPAAAAALLAGAGRVRVSDALFLAERVTLEPPLWLGLRLPDASLDAAVFPQRGDYVRNVLAMVAASVLLALAYFFLQGVVDRAVRLSATERYLARIRAESRRYRALLEGAADLVVILDPAERSVREANGMAREALGLSAVMRGASLEALLEPEGSAALAAAIDRAWASPGEVVALQGLRLRGLRGPLETDARLVAMDLEDEQVVQVALRDMTLQRQMERKLATADRLSALGLLTAGVAHEINNPLEGIGNYLALMEREDLPPERRRRHVEQVRHGFARIREIVRGLLEFVRPDVERGQADLGEVARRAHELVRYAEELRDVEVEIAAPAGALRVEGDPGRLEQVLINLLLNAGQAMGGRGRVTISARRDQDGEVVLTVDDRGPGIPADRLARLFDPFYSSGSDGSPRGTGLGLSVSYGIVRAHGGSLGAENLPGGGARFTLRLPGAGATSGSRS